MGESAKNGNGFTPTWRWFVGVLASAAVLSVLGAAWASYQRLERVEAAVSMLPAQTALLRAICRNTAPSEYERSRCDDYGR